MTTLGFCTHFTQTDEWAFEYALNLVKSRGWQLNICHWLVSPYLLRRDLVQDELLPSNSPVQITPRLLTQLELQLRQRYDPLLGDFTNVAFKLCEGQYQVELVRCLRKNQLDLVVMGYPLQGAPIDPGSLPIEEFAVRLPYPLILVGWNGPQSFLLNAKAVEWLHLLDIPEGGWELLEPQKI